MTSDLFDEPVRAMEHDKRLYADRDAALLRRANPMTPAVRRDAGIAAAIAHADRVTPEWRAAAVEWVRLYALHADERFLAEDVRTLAECTGLSAPTDGRAWGQVMRDAVKQGYIVADGYLPAKSSNLSPKVAWRKAKL